MRIRKGKRCLSLAPADRCFVQEEVVKRERGGGGEEDSCADQEVALLRLVSLAATTTSGKAGAGIVSGRRQAAMYLEHAKFGTSPERLNKYLEHQCDLGKLNRVSADDNFHERSLIQETDIDSALRKFTATSPGAKSVFTRHKSPGASGTISSSTSAIEIKDQRPNQSEQSLRHICSRAGDSEISRGEMVSSTDMIEAARQLQNMLKSHSNSLGSGVVEVGETPPCGGENHKAVQSRTKASVRQPKLGTNLTGITTVQNQKSSSSAFRSQNVTQREQSEFQCKREDGKGWRCSRPAEGGYNMCSYHREQICRAQSRRKRPKFAVEPTVAVKSSSSRYIVNTRAVPNAELGTASDYCPFLDDELAYDERREFVKAKSLKSLLLNKDVRPIIF